MALIKGSKQVCDKTIARLIAALWVVWSLFHILPGIVSMIAAIDGDISFIHHLEPKPSPEALKEAFPSEVFAVLVVYGQHGFNLFWFGCVTLVCSIFVWMKQNRMAMLMAGVVAGCADLGVIFFIDLLGGYGSNFGRLILMVAVTAIALSVHLVMRSPPTEAG